MHPWRHDFGHGPAVFAHRGASAHRAEHTLGAYERALEVGADGLECDVRLTADGHLVLVHDRRIDRTSSGTGVVSAQTLSQLRRHDFTTWHGGEDPIPDPDRDSVLTLERLLELALSYDRPIRLLIETKHPNRYGGFLERRLVQELQRFGLARPPRDGTSPVVVMSFSEIALRRLRQYAPGIPRVMLMERVPLRFRGGYLPYGASIAGPSIEIVRRHPGYVRRVHNAGNQLYCWVVDDLDDVDLCASIDVDGIITNRPQQALDNLRSTGLRP